MNLYSKILNRAKLIRRKIFSCYSHGWVVYHNRKTGINFLLNRDSYIDYLIWVDGSYNGELIKTLDLMINKFNIGVFFDIGANIGEVSLSIKKKHLEISVYAFEPIFSNYLQNCMGILINHLEINLYNCALGSQTGKISLYEPATNLSTDYNKSNLGMFSIMGGNNRFATEVDCFSFVDFCKKNDVRINQPALIKIDVEGSELEVLKGMQDILEHTTVPIIIVTELNFSHSDIYYEVVAFLFEFGYQIYDLQLMPVQVSNKSLNGDYVFIKNLL